MVQSIILTGPTAVGKTSIALELASRMNLEIINADSVCFYREFNIGSAKPRSQDLTRVPHHLIDVAGPLDLYHAGQFLSDCEALLKDIHSRGRRALIVGGSGFYLKALRFGLWDAPPTSPAFRRSLEETPTEVLHLRLKALDPVQAEKVSPSDRYRLIRALEIIELSGSLPSELQAQMESRPNPAFPLWVIDRDPVELGTRILDRIDTMLREGWIQEVETLLRLYPDSRVLHSVGYRQVVDYLMGRTPAGRRPKPGIPGLRDEIALAHRQLAKTQRTWFKGLSPEESFLLDSQADFLKEKLMAFYQ